MARTDRLKRLRAELWLLEESSEGLTARELGRQLDVSARTVRRDLLTLRASGYPLSSAGARWRFVEGQALPTALAADGANQAPERDRVIDLDRAIRQRRPVEVRHWSLGPGGSVRLLLAPFLLRYFEGTLFLVAREHPVGRIRTLAVERLGRIRTEKGKYPKTAKKGLERYLQNRMRHDAADALVRVTVRFSPEMAWRVTERIWHPSQRVTLDDDGSAIVTLRVPGFAWIKAWALGFGANAIVVEPPELVDLMCKELEKTKERYVHLQRQLPQLDLFAGPK